MNNFKGFFEYHFIQAHFFNIDRNFVCLIYNFIWISIILIEPERPLTSVL